MNFELKNWCTLPTSVGDFRMYDMENENISLICMGDINELSNNTLFRVHSSCRASEVFGALDCDCADQLKEAMKMIASEGSGLIIYQHQEGRGHGLSLKIQAVSLMEEGGLDTAEAFDALNLSQDVRSYVESIAVLKQLDINSVRLVSNNPRKKAFLKKHGIEVSSVNTHPNIRPENSEYLKTKNTKLGHNLPLESEASSDTIHFYHADQPWGEFTNVSEHAIFLRNKIWPSVEHFYQAQKFSQLELQEEIRSCETPILAKQYAYNINAKHCRSDWMTIREAIMLEGLTAKFSQHPNLRTKLMNTANRHLVELTNQDNYWGDPGDGTGQNRLGYLLMQVRKELFESPRKHTEAA
ncbi:GTP cyclohydrolase II [Sinobacterium caligoides]|uniref:GTP cyclohydrolase II n=1 Tax=Sinobacterium caligoides TaxID=933926 RepID=A0A3N2DK61_9GAMM|nr:GTP cyclohydrolase II RibA [Sinobacterium caligoides]ROS00194.1 GTP cyclohydrolase II [Sinobacterium caligoides]